MINSMGGGGVMVVASMYLASRKIVKRGQYFGKYNIVENIVI